MDGGNYEDSAGGVHGDEHAAGEGGHGKHCHEDEDGAECSE